MSSRLLKNTLKARNHFSFQKATLWYTLDSFSLLYLHLYREVSRIRASSVLLPHGIQESVLRVLLGRMVLWFFWYKKHKFTHNH